MILGVDPKIDYAFKWLFGREQNAELLIDLINAVLGPSLLERVIDVEILNPFTDKVSEDDKLSILDVKARDQDGWQLNIEMQMLPDQHFRKRLLYYWGKLRVQQLREADPYAELRPTISIAFINAAVFEHASRYHYSFAIREASTALLFSDDLALHILEIPRFNKSAEYLTTALDLWLYFLRYAETLDPAALPKALDVAIIRQAMKELTMLTQDEIERERYEARVKMHRDELSRVLSARETGKAEGRAEGAAEELMDHIRALQQMMHAPVTPREELRQRDLEFLRSTWQELQTELARLLSKRRDGNGQSN